MTTATNTPAAVECYALGTISAAYFLILQDLFRSVRSDMGGMFVEPKAREHLYRRGLIVADRDINGRPMADSFVPSEKAESGLRLEGPNGEYMIEPRNAWEARLVVEVPEWAEPPPSALGLPL